MSLSNQNLQYFSQVGIVPSLKLNPNKKMTEKNLEEDEFYLAPGTFTRLSDLSRDQFMELMSCNHPEAVKYRRYANKEFEYRKKGDKALNSFYHDRYLKE